MKGPRKPRLNIHLLVTSCHHDSRVLKAVAAAEEHAEFDAVHIVAVGDGTLQEREDLSERALLWRIPLTTKRLGCHLVWQLVKQLEWVMRILWRYRSCAITIIHCHGIDALSAALLLKWRYGAKLIYDAHELETETHSMRGARKVVGKVTEKICMRGVDAVISVNDSIAQWYQNAYQLERVTVIRNIPLDSGQAARRSSILREKFGIAKDQLLFLYQGGLVAGRGISRMLTTFARLGEAPHLVLLGYGPLQALVEKAARQYPNIHFHRAVPPREVLNYTAGADVGVHLIENTCLNHYLCLPNKVFEYMHCGLPMLLSNFPEMARLIEEGRCGWLVPDDDEALIAMIRRDIDWASVTAGRQKVLAAAEQYQWREERTKLLNLYADID